MEPTICDWLAEERKEVLESVAECLGTAREDAEELAACSYLLRHRRRPTIKNRRSGIRFPPAFDGPPEARIQIGHGEQQDSEDGEGRHPVQGRQKPDVVEVKL